MDKNEFACILNELIKLEEQIDALHQKLIDCREQSLKARLNRQLLAKELNKIKIELEESLKKSADTWKKTPLATRQTVGKILNKELTLEQGIEKLQRDNIIYD